MTKTLTEQWREGTLPVGSYYINLVGDVERVDFFGGLEFERTKAFGIEEVLAPVPSYDELQAELSSNDELLNVQKRLEKKLEIATKALKEYKEDYFITTYGGRLVNPYPHIARKALKEMEGVK